MKINRTLVRLPGVMIVLALLVWTRPCIGADEQIAFSFDSIFPPTPYKDALGACMQVLGYLDQLCQEQERGEHMAFGLVHDAFFGKVVSAQYKIKNLVENIQSGALVADDNVAYLSTILGYISTLYKDRIVQEQRNALATTMIDEMVARMAHITTG